MENEQAPTLGLGKLRELLEDAAEHVASYRVLYEPAEEGETPSYECGHCGNARGWPWHDAGCPVLLVEELADAARGQAAPESGVRPEHLRAMADWFDTPGKSPPIVVSIPRARLTAGFLLRAIAREMGDATGTP